MDPQDATDRRPLAALDGGVSTFPSMTRTAEPISIDREHQPVLDVRRPTLGQHLRDVRHWMQLIRFGLVGASGAVVNLIVFTILNHGFGVHYLVAGVGAFLVAAVNNYTWNRGWTFRDQVRRSHARQLTQFAVVAALVLLPNLLLLWFLNEKAGIHGVFAQMIAVVIVTPISFLGQKLWTFR
jgi:putative flippase GtrA